MLHDRDNAIAHFCMLCICYLKIVTQTQIALKCHVVLISLQKLLKFGRMARSKRWNRSPDNFHSLDIIKLGQNITTKYMYQQLHSYIFDPSIHCVGKYAGSEIMTHHPSSHPNYYKLERKRVVCCRSAIFYNSVIHYSQAKLVYTRPTPTYEQMFAFNAPNITKLFQSTLLPISEGKNFLRLQHPHTQQRKSDIILFHGVTSIDLLFRILYYCLKENLFL